MRSFRVGSFGNQKAPMTPTPKKKNLHMIFQNTNISPIKEEKTTFFLTHTLKWIKQKDTFNRD